jgi:hypothetical protein
MTVSFPSSPSPGDTYTYEAITYTYDGEKWVGSTASSFNEVTISGTSANVILQGNDNITTDQIFLDSNGNVDIGSGNILLNADGSATFAGDFFTFGDLDFVSPTTAQSGVAFRYGSIKAKRDDSSSFTIWSGCNTAGDETSAITGNGSATFVGNINTAGLYLRDGTGFIDVKRRLYYATDSSDSLPVFIGNKQIQVFTPSDRRTKENIQPTTVNATDIIKGLEVVDFNFIGSGLYETDDTSQKVGFIAQDVDEVFPQAVQQPHEDGGLLSVRKEELIPVLTKALQTALTRIEALEAEVTALKEGN